MVIQYLYTPPSTPGPMSRQKLGVVDLQNAKFAVNASWQKISDAGVQISMLQKDYRYQRHLQDAKWRRCSQVISTSIIIC